MAIPKITLRNKSGSEGKALTGANTELLLDGKPVRGATSVKIEVKSKSVAKVTIELIASVDVDISADIVEKKPAKVKGKIYGKKVK